MPCAMPYITLTLLFLKLSAQVWGIVAVVMGLEDHVGWYQTPFGWFMDSMGFGHRVGFDSFTWIGPEIGKVDSLCFVLCRCRAYLLLRPICCHCSSSNPCPNYERCGLFLLSASNTVARITFSRTRLLWETSEALAVVYV